MHVPKDGRCMLDVKLNACIYFYLFFKQKIHPGIIKSLEIQKLRREGPKNIFDFEFASNMMAGSVRTTTPPKQS